MAAKLQRISTLKSLDEVNQKLADLKICNARLQKKESELNLKRTELENKYTPELTALKSEQLLMQSDIELFANEHKAELTTKRSWEMLHGVIGFRQSQKLATANKLRWCDVLEKLKEAGKKLSSFVRIKEEVAKDELKSAIQSGDVTLDEAASVGVKIETLDNFFIETSSIDSE